MKKYMSTPTYSSCKSMRKRERKQLTSSGDSNNG